MANVNRSAYKAQGLCGCGRKPRPGLKTCKPCGDKRSKYLSTRPLPVEVRKRKVARRKQARGLKRAAGLCNSCPGKPRPGKQTCKRCGDKQRMKIAAARTDPAYMQRTRQWNSISRRKLRLDVLNAYGGPTCKCCDEEHLEFLTVDHIEKPTAESKLLGYRSGVGFYQWLRKNNYPAGFRVLCLNCNFAIGHHGYCPHRNL